MMKGLKILRSINMILTILALPAIGAERAVAPESEYRVTVQVDFANSSDYRDIDLDGMGTRKGRQIVLDKIGDVFRSEAQKFLPPGYALEVQVQDVDLAGEYEPERFPHDDVRIDKAIYPPRITFDYLIFDDSETLVGEGSARLSDMNYLQNPIRPIRGKREIAYDVSTLIRDWMSSKLNRKMKDISAWDK